MSCFDPTSPRRPAGWWILAVMLIAPAVAFAQGVDQPQLRPGVQESPRAAQPGLPQIQRPADPDKVMGTFQLGEETIEVTEGAFFATYELLKPHRERPNQPLRQEQVLEHIFLLAEATSLGCAPTPEELGDLSPLKGRDEAYAKQIRDRWTAMGTSEEEQLRYIGEVKAIERMKLLMLNSARVRSTEVYDLWKRDNLMYSVGYLAFPASRYEEELRGTPVDQTKLKEFWNSNTQVQTTYRRPTTVSGDLFVFDPSKVTDADIQQARARRGATVSYEESVAYFNQNRERLMNQIASSDRPKLYPKDPPSVSELVTPFSLLRDQIEREILLGDRMGKAYEAAKASTKLDAEAIAREFGLQYVNVKEQSREELQKDNAALGYQLFQKMFTTDIGAVSPAIHHNDGLQYFWRLGDKKISTLPDFKDALAMGLQEKYIAHEAYARAKADADAVMDAVTKLAAQALSAEEAQIKAEIAKQRDAAIADLPEKSDEQVSAVKTRYDAQEMARINQLRVQKRSAYFDEYMSTAEKKLTRLGPFVFRNAYVDRSTLTDPQELEESFIKTNYAIRALQPGQITSVVSDVVTQTHYIVQLTGRDDPPFEQMSAVEFYQRKTQLERQKTYSNNYNWNFMRLKMRLGWTEL